MKLAILWIRFALPVLLLFSTVPTFAADHAETEEGASSEGAHEGEGHGDESGHGHHGSLNLADFSNKEAPPLAALLFNFTALVVIVFLLMRKPLGARFRDRKAALVKALEEAEDAKKAAEETIAAARAKMVAVDEEMANIRKAILSTGVRESERIAAAAEAGAERMAKDAKMLATQEISRMTESIRNEIVERIVAEAADIIREKITDADRDNLSDRYLTEIGKTAQIATEGK